MPGRERSTLPKELSAQAVDFPAQFSAYTRKLEIAAQDPSRRDDLLAVIGRVMEHSLEDGLALATRFRLTPKELQETCLTKRFSNKHQQISRHIRELEGRHHIRTGSWDATPAKTDTLEFQDLYDEADRIFAPLLAERDLAFKTQTQQSSTTDRFLAHLDRAFQKSYYTGPVREYLIKHDLTPWAALQDLQSPTITHAKLHDLLDQACKERGVLPDDLDQALTDARYLVPFTVAQAEQARAEEEITRDLNDTWRSKGYEVVLNEETDRYELKPLHPDADTEKRETKEAIYLSDDDILDEMEALLDRASEVDYWLTAHRVFVSMSGMGSSRAWALRERYLSQYPENHPDVSRGLGGIDSKRADEIRTKTLEQFHKLNAYGADEDSIDNAVTALSDVLEGCTGVDSPKAWEIRNIALEEIRQVQKYSDRQREDILSTLIRSLAFIDTSEAWLMRENGKKMVRDYLPDYSIDVDLAASLTGCRGKNAQDLRKKWRETDDDWLVLHSLMGDDSPEAWDMRNSAALDNDRAAIYSTIGCDAAHAKEFRDWADKPKHEKALRLSMMGLQTDEAKEARKGLEGFELIKQLNGANPIEALAWRHAREDHKRALAEKNSELPEWITEEEMIAEIKRVEAEQGDTVEALEHLSLLDSPQANALKAEYKAKELEADEFSYIGHNTRQVQVLRLVDFLKNTPSIIESLVGIDDEEAWKLRNRAMRMIHKKHTSPIIKALLISLGGCHSPAAQAMRERLYYATTELDEFILKSIIGIDDVWAWSVREVHKKSDPFNTLRSLVGLRTPRAMAMRRELEPQVGNRLPGFKDEKGHVVLGTLAENFIWLQAKRREEAERPNKKEEPPDLSDEQLELLNLVHHPTAAAVHGYVQANENPVKLGPAQPTRKHLATLSSAIKEEAKIFLESFAAKADRAPHLMAERLFYRMHPEVERKKRISLGGLTSRIGSFFGHGERLPAPQPDDHLRAQTEGRIDGGGESAFNDERAVVEFRDPINGFIASDVFGAYDPGTNLWKQAEFPVTTELGEPVRETTGTIEPSTQLVRIRLPKPIEANILPDRIKGIQADGTEITLQAEIDHLGMVTVENQAGVKRIVYSLEVSEAPAPMLEVSTREYESFVKQLTRGYGADLQTTIASLPEDVVAQIRTQAFYALSPKGQVQFIEKLVRSLGHYDVKNEDTLGEKRGKSIQDQITLGELRVIELREDGVPDLEGKRFAGVCADFALITTALLREAGFAAGTMRGFQPEGRVAKMRDAHGTAYVVWPSNEGGYRIIPVDGTPGSDDPNFTHVASPALAERETEAETVAQQALESARKEFQTFMDTLESKDPTAIKKLTNGKLERALNVILRYEVNEVHTDVLKEMMDLYWYGGLQNMERVQSDVELRKAMEEYLDTRRPHIAQSAAKRPQGAGTTLFDAVREFTRKHKKATGETDSTQALATLEHIGELAGAALTEPEQRALTAIITYLRAKQVSSSS